MIKQLLFVRNIYKLINWLCVAIFAVIALYSLLSAAALADGFGKLFQSRYASLLVVPLIQLVLTLVLLWKSYNTKPYKNSVADDQTTNIQLNLLRELTIGTNLMLSLILTFVQLNIINTAKGIPSFGRVPIYLCIAVGIVFYIYKIKNALSDK